jgi:hypothetical protein
MGRILRIDQRICLNPLDPPNPRSIDPLPVPFITQETIDATDHA